MLRLGVDRARAQHRRRCSDTQRKTVVTRDEAQVLRPAPHRCLWSIERAGYIPLKRLAESLYLLVTPPPRKSTAAMTAMAIRATRRRYSTRLAPRSSTAIFARR